MLLMLGVGLHFSVSDLLAVRRLAIPGAIGQIIIATAIGIGLAVVWGSGFGAGLVFGLSLSVASTAVLLKALENRGTLATANGASRWAGCEMALLSGDRRTADVTALDYSRFAMLSGRDFLRFLAALSGDSRPGRRPRGRTRRARRRGRGAAGDAAALRGRPVAPKPSEAMPQTDESTALRFLTCGRLQVGQAPRAEDCATAQSRIFGPWPSALGPSGGKRVVAMKLDSSANIRRPQAI